MFDLLNSDVVFDSFYHLRLINYKEKIVFDTGVIFKHNDKLRLLVYMVGKIFLLSVFFILTFMTFFFILVYSVYIFFTEKIWMWNRLLAVCWILNNESSLHFFIWWWCFKLEWKISISAGKENISIINDLNSKISSD